jgi:DNA-binding response OmpR family regulator
VLVDSYHLPLTPTQYRLLQILAKQPDTLVTTAELSQSIWNCDANDGVASLVATQVSRIRAKLRDTSPTAPAIVSVSSRGYRLLVG